MHEHDRSDDVVYGGRQHQHPHEHGDGHHDVAGTAEPPCSTCVRITVR